MLRSKRSLSPISKDQRSTSSTSSMANGRTNASAITANNRMNTAHIAPAMTLKEHPLLQSSTTKKTKKTVPKRPVTPHSTKDKNFIEENKKLLKKDDSPPVSPQPTHSARHLNALQTRPVTPPQSSRLVANSLTKENKKKAAPVTPPVNMSAAASSKAITPSARPTPAISGSAHRRSHVATPPTPKPADMTLAQENKKLCALLAERTEELEEASKDLEEYQSVIEQLQERMRQIEARNRELQTENDILRARVIEDAVKSRNALAAKSPKNMLSEIMNNCQRIRGEPVTNDAPVSPVINDNHDVTTPITAASTPALSTPAVNSTPALKTPVLSSLIAPLKNASDAPQNKVNPDAFPQRHTSPLDTEAPVQPRRNLTPATAPAAVAPTHQPQVIQKPERVENAESTEVLCDRQALNMAKAEAAARNTVMEESDESEGEFDFEREDISDVPEFSVFSQAGSISSVSDEEQQTSDEEYDNNLISAPISGPLSEDIERWKSTTSGKYNTDPIPEEEEDEDDEFELPPDLLKHPKQHLDQISSVAMNSSLATPISNVAPQVTASTTFHDSSETQSSSQKQTAHQSTSSLTQSSSPKQTTHRRLRRQRVGSSGSNTQSNSIGQSETPSTPIQASCLGSNNLATPSRQLNEKSVTNNTENSHRESFSSTASSESDTLSSSSSRGSSQSSNDSDLAYDSMTQKSLTPVTNENDDSNINNEQNSTSGAYYGQSNFHMSAPNSVTLEQQYSNSQRYGNISPVDNSSGHSNSKRYGNISPSDNSSGHSNYSQRISSSDNSSGHSNYSRRVSSSDNSNYSQRVSSSDNSSGHSNYSQRVSSSDNSSGHSKRSQSQSSVTSSRRSSGSSTSSTTNRQPRLSSASQFSHQIINAHNNSRASSPSQSRAPSPPSSPHQLPSPQPQPSTTKGSFATLQHYLRILSETCNMQNPLKFYDVQKQLDEGSSAKVYSAVSLDPADRTDYAIKIIPLSYSLEFIYNEIYVLMNLKHRNVVHFKESFLRWDGKNREIWIVMEKCRGDVTSRAGKITPKQVGRVARDILNALKHLDANGIIHRDIKLSNILINANNEVKLADFGISSLTPTSTTGMVGTIPYMAPDIVNVKPDRPYNTKVDIWSLGVCVLELLTGKAAWGRMRDDEIMDRLRRGERPYGLERLRTKGDCEWEAINFLECCFAKDSESRYSAEELLQHPFITNHTM